MIFLTTKPKLAQEVNRASASKLTWKDKTYIHGPDFAPDAEDAAVEYCQKIKKLSCLLVDNESYLSVWIETKSSLKKAQMSRAQLKKDFILYCEQELAEFIGPMATLVCQDTLDLDPTISKAEFVQALAEYIKNPQQALKFKEQLSAC